MEGDAGASRLNPADTDDSSSEPHEAEQTSTETTAEGLVETEAEDESEAEVDLDTETEAEDESEAEVDLDTETEAEDESEAEVDLDTETDAEDESEGGKPPHCRGEPLAPGPRVVDRHHGSTSRARRRRRYRWLFRAARQPGKPGHRAPRRGGRAGRKGLCGGNPGARCQCDDRWRAEDHRLQHRRFPCQAMLYSSLFVEAYQVANVHAQVSDMRAGAERNYDDGSVDVLVAFRVKVSNSQTQDREVGYRLRVKMAPAEGQYRIANIDQVAK